MEKPDLRTAAQVLAESEIYLQEVRGSWRLVIEGNRESFRSSPLYSTADAEAARRVLEQFGGWGGSSEKPTRRTTEEESVPETTEASTNQVGEAAGERAGGEGPGQGREEPEEQAAGKSVHKKERKDRQWREKEVQKVVRAISHLRS